MPHHTFSWEKLGMMKNMIVGFAILAVSMSTASAAKKHMAKPEAAAPAPLAWTPGPTAAEMKDAVFRSSPLSRAADSQVTQ